MTITVKDADYSKRTVRFDLADTQTMEGDRGEPFTPTDLVVVLDREGEGPWHLHSATINGPYLKTDGKPGKMQVKKRLTAWPTTVAPRHAEIRNDCPDWARDAIAQVLRSAL